MNQQPDPRRTGMLIGYRVISELVGKASSFVLILLTARFLTKEEFAVLSLGYATGWILSVASDFGMQIYLAREVAKTPEIALHILKVLLRRRLKLTVLLFLALLAVSLATGWPVLRAAFFLIVIAQVLGSLIDFLCYFLRGLSRSDLESSFTLGYRPATLLVVATCLVMNGRLTSVAVTLAAGSLLGLLFVLRLCWRVGSRYQPAGADPTLPLEERLGSYREFLPIGAGIVFSALYFRSDLYLIEWWRGLEAVALYNAVFRLIDALRLLPSALLAVIFPRLCRETSNRVVIIYGSMLASAGLILALVTARLSPWIVSLAYGPNYLDAVGAFQILLWALPLLYLNFLLTHQLIAWDLQNYFAALCGAGLVVNLCLNVALVPSLGIRGAAWATVLTEVFLTAGWTWILLSRRKKIAS